MCILYTDSLKYVIPRGVEVKVYADDVKLYSRSCTVDDKCRLQSTLDAFKGWADALDFDLSIHKCGVSTLR